MTFADDEKKKFSRSIALSLASYSELRQAIHNKKNQASLETVLAEQFCLSHTIIWENFLHDLLISYCAMSPDTFLRDLKARMKTSSSDRFGPSAAGSITVSFARKKNKKSLALLIDKEKQNITITSADKLREKANQLLSSKFAVSFALTKEDAELVDLAISLRNYLAHKSAKSRGILVSQVASVGDPDFHQAKLPHVGTYLKHIVPGQGEITRTILFANKLVDISTRL